MKKQRKHYTGEEKVAILRRHLLDKELVSQLCDELGLQPTVFYRWQKEFFENGARAFERREQKPSKRLLAKNEKLEARLADKDEVIAEIIAEHVKLKKTLGVL